METTESLLGRGLKWWSHQVSEPGSFCKSDPLHPTHCCSYPRAGLLLISMGGRRMWRSLVPHLRFLDGRCPKPLPVLYPPLISASLLTTLLSTVKSRPCPSLRLGFTLNKGPQKQELEGSLGACRSFVEGTGGLWSKHLSKVMRGRQCRAVSELRPVTPLLSLAGPLSPV